MIPSVCDNGATRALGSSQTLFPAYQSLSIFIYLLMPCYSSGSERRQRIFEFGRVMLAWFGTLCLLTVGNLLLVIDFSATVEVIPKLDKVESTVVRFKAVRIIFPHQACHRHSCYDLSSEGVLCCLLAAVLTFVTNLYRTPKAIEQAVSDLGVSRT